MALASYQPARSPVELSLSPLYHYQYSSIYAPMREMAANPTEYAALVAQIQQLCLSYHNFGDSSHPLVLQTDALPVCKAYSPTLSNRTYIKVPNNIIPFNKPLSIGYQYSSLNLSATDSPNSWSIPLSTRRIDVEQTANECALMQLTDFLQNNKKVLLNRLIINLLDSGYGTPSYMCDAYNHENVVSNVRLRYGSKVWSCGINTNPTGATKVYGQKYYLVPDRKRPFTQKFRNER